MDYELVDGRVVRGDGRVAVQHYKTDPTNIQVKGEIYIFLPKRQVCMAWVKPEHVADLLKVRTKSG